MLVLICVYSLAYVTESVATWDFSGSYTESREDDMTLSETTLTYTLIQDAKGKLTGSGTFDYYSDENDISIDSIDFEIKGKVKGKNNIVTLKYTLKGKGSGYVLGDVLADVLGKDTDVKLKDKVSLELNKSSLSLMGTMKRKLCAKGSGCEADTSQVSLDVPDGMTGGGILMIYVEPDENGKKFEGSAELTLSNDEVFPLYFKGKYNSKKDDTKFSLKGVDAFAKGMKLKLEINGRNGAATFIGGKVLGQQLKI